MTTPLDIAREAWGDSLPGWVERLARECEASTQNKVATRLGRSASLVSAVLRNKYQGDMKAVEDLVRGVFERTTVACPALGTLRYTTCRDWQEKSRTYSTVNSERQRMFRACNKCPRNRTA
ncbi:hypothetical protein, partial [Salipiger marinus]|uniref:hypothetical protein n=1 Tax=Salipiger marinus TaxID=555512 RepID=UPI00405947C5